MKMVCVAIGSPWDFMKIRKCLWLLTHKNKCKDTGFNVCFITPHQQPAQKMVQAQNAKRKCVLPASNVSLSRCIVLQRSARIFAVRTQNCHSDDLLLSSLRVIGRRISRFWHVRVCSSFQLGKTSLAEAVIRNFTEIHYIFCRWCFEFPEDT